MESIRWIEPKDNVALAAVIRAALTEFGPKVIERKHKMPMNELEKK